MIKKLPIPAAAIMLSFASLGNLLVSYGDVYRNILGAISAIMFIALVLKIIMYPKNIVEEMKNPVVAGVASTFPMGIMVLSTYIKAFSSSFAFGFWIFGILIHCILIVYFTKKFILKFDINKVFPSYFVVYVGIVVASVTAPAHSMESLGQAIFWFGLVAYIILLPIVLYRVVKVKNIPEPAQPTIAIFAAPGSLCLAGYMNSFADKNISMIGFLTILSSLVFFAVIIYMPKLLKLKFYPSYAAFTFPVVISAMGLKGVNVFLMKTDQSIIAISYLVKFEEILSLSIVLYVFIKYIVFITAKDLILEQKIN